MNNSSVIEKEEKERPLKELLSSAIVDIYVGPHKQHWPIHENLLCYRSSSFSRIFSEHSSKSSRGAKSFTLPNEDDEQPFTMLVVWLYSRCIQKPVVENDIGALLDLYLLANKFEMPTLEAEVVDAVREFYCSSSTYPALRRVQYVYANTTEDNPMRDMIVLNVARHLVTGETIPAHWAKALQRNGQLAFDIIGAIRQRTLEELGVPRVEETATDRERLAGNFFNVIEENPGTSIETWMTDGTTNTNPGVQNVGLVPEKVVTKDCSTGKDLEGSSNEEFGKSSLLLSPQQLEFEAGARSMNDLRVTTRRRGFEIPPSLAKPEFAVLGVAWLFYALYINFTWRQS